MFTGIIDHCATIKTLQTRSGAMTLWLQTQFEDLVEGESIAVDGICLTVVEPNDGSFRCDLSPETLALTTAQHFSEGGQVNVERALRLMDRLGGHFVMGHVDVATTVTLVKTVGEYTEMRFVLPPMRKKFITSKGSVTVNGVSLTINEVTETEFAVMLIPHTLERTNLHTVNAGDSVNIEYDTIARIVVENLV